MPNYEQPQSFSRLSISGHSSSDCRIVRRIWWMPNRCPSLSEYAGCFVENDAARSILLRCSLNIARSVLWWLHRLLYHRTSLLLTSHGGVVLGVYTVRSSDRLVGPTQATSDWSVRPVGPTGRTDCSWTAHICQSNQCGLLADWPPLVYMTAAAM